MYNYTYSKCQTPNEIEKAGLRIKELVFGEHGTVLHSFKNETSFWAIFTLTWSSVGIALSAAALALLILTASLFAEWRRNYKNQLLIQFMFARLLYSSVRFFSDIQKMFQLCPQSPHLMSLDILSMIYSELVLVTWMFIFSRQMYLCLVKVFLTEGSNIWIVSVCAWLGPAVISLFLHLIFYVSGDSEIRYFIMYLMTIKWPLLIANAVLLILVLRSILMNNKKTENNMRIIIVMIVLIFVFCFQQIAIDLCKIVFVKIFDKSNIVTTFLLVSNILAMYHCAFSITFWVLGNANTRKLWRFQGKGLRDKIRLSVRFSA